LPLPHVPNLALYPRLHRNHYIKLNRLRDEELDHIPAEKATVCPQPYLFFVTGQFLDELFDKPNGIIRAMMFAVSENASDIVSRLAHEAQKGMVALSALFLGIVSKTGSLLIAVHRHHMRVQIKGYTFKALKPLPELHKKIKVQRRNLFCHRNSHTRQKPTDGGLNRKAEKPYQLLEYFVSRKNLHLIRPAIAQKYAVKTAYKYQTSTIFALPAALYYHPTIDQLPNRVPIKKPPDQTAASKPGEVVASKFFFHSLYFFVAIASFLKYALFHLLSASFIVFKALSLPFSYYIWRHFSSENYVIDA
jgi:hypothetical protein